MTDQWYAGAEIELLEGCGLDIAEDIAYCGMGRAPVTVQPTNRGKYRNVAGEAGLTGHRLAWTAKAIWKVIARMGAPIDSDYRTNAIKLAWKMSPRARAYRRELNRMTDTAMDTTTRTILSEALRTVGDMSLLVRDIPPLL